MDPHELAERPGWCDDLVAEVDLAFVVTGAGTPGWADPHPDRDPTEEEYSRCLEPQKYRILQTRADAWVQTLAARGLADTRTTADDTEGWDGRSLPPPADGRVWRIEPRRPGALTLLLTTTLVDDAPFGTLIGVDSDGSSPALIGSIPSCGCDACDSGSADLVELLDGWVLTVLRGGVVHASDGRNRLTRTFDGWSGRSRDGEVDQTWLDPDTTPPGVRRWWGQPWL